MTAKQRVVLGALRDAQHAHDGQAVSAGQIAASRAAKFSAAAALKKQLNS